MIHETISNHQQVIEKIEGQLLVQEARRAAGLPHRDLSWEKSARYALARYQEELAAMEDLNNG